jgi:pilus assembly protein CpaB
MDRRFITVMGISLLFALVISTLFYSLTARSAGRPRAQKKVEMTTVATAATALSVGVEIKPADIKLVSIPRDRFPAGGFEKAEQVVGRPVISNILLDEPIMAGRLAERGSGFGLAPMIPTGMRAVTVKVNEVIGVAGFLLSGMRVDVLVTMRPAGEGGARTNTVLQNIVVAAAGQQIQPDATGKAVNVPVVTLLVTPEQAEALTLAGNEGRIQLVLRNSGDQSMPKTRGSEVGDLYGSNRPVAAPVIRAASAKAPAAAVAAPAAPPPPPDEVLVIRGSQASMEKVGGGRPK